MYSPSETKTPVNGKAHTIRIGPSLGAGLWEALEPGELPGFDEGELPGELPGLDDGVLLGVPHPAIKQVIIINANTIASVFLIFYPPL